MIKTYRVRDIPENTGSKLKNNGLPAIGETLKGTLSPCGTFINDTFAWRLEEVKPEVHSVTAVPEVSITRKRLTIDKIVVGQTFIIHGQPETVYVKISNSHVFNHKRLQMHTTVAERFKQHLNLVAVELVVFNGK